MKAYFSKNTGRPYFWWDEVSSQDEGIVMSNDNSWTCLGFDDSSDREADDWIEEIQSESDEHYDSLDEQEAQLRRENDARLRCG